MLNLSLVNLLQILICAQGSIFVLFLVISRRGKRNSNLVLATLLILVVVQMVTLLFQDQGLLYREVTIPQLSALLYGPLLYRYVRELVYRDLRLSSWEAFHLMPFAAALAARFTAWLTPSRLAVAVFASMGFYLVLSFRALGNYRRVLRSTRSHFEGITLSWLSKILGGVATLMVLDVASFVSSATLPVGMETVVSVAVFAALLAFVTALVLNGLRHPELFGGITLEDEAIAFERKSESTGDAPHLNEAEVGRLQRFMKVEKPYLEPDLTLAGLATAIKVPPRRLSQLINQRLRQNFSDFVNSYRVEEAKSRLVEPESGRESILDLLFAVGFNSKSSFNAAFKRRTGLTPTEYRERHLQ